MNTSAIKNVLRNLLGEKLTARIHGYWFLRLIKTKPLPDREVNYLRNLNLRDTLALDVGANGANWTKALSDLVGPAGKVIGFEAHPYYFQATRAAVSYDEAMSMNSFIYPTAMSDQQSTLSLLIRENGVYLDGESRIIDFEGSQPLNSVIAEVEALELDVFLNNNGLEETKISVIKLDVEGHESHVIRGALKCIGRWLPVIVCELNKGEVGELCHVEIRKVLENFGYELFITDGSSLKKFTALSQLDNHFSRNIICIHHNETSVKGRVC
jgi:FkbM family methyltransferase